MPLFEFECVECLRSFEGLVRISKENHRVICPFCGSDLTRKKISTFASRLDGASIHAPSSSGLQEASCSSGIT
jgi:putative FmdB family regulatory protein